LSCIILSVISVILFYLYFELYPSISNLKNGGFAYHLSYYYFWSSHSSVRLQVSKSHKRRDRKVEKKAKVEVRHKQKISNDAAVDGGQEQAKKRDSNTAQLATNLVADHLTILRI